MLPEQLKSWLAERNYQIRKVGNEYHITQKDHRAEVYELDLELDSGTITVSPVTFAVSEGVLYITIEGIGEAGFKLDEYGNLRAVDPTVR